ncbi:MAG: NAD(P)H-dependent glycerol-3-phosphate dehydrogenase [Pseudomonadota bacterium]
MRGNASFSSIGVVGGGAWGTALAQLAATNGVSTLLWAREAAVAEEIMERRENTKFLPDVALDERLKATSDLANLRGREAYVFVAPAQYARGLFGALKEIASADAPLALCSKGIERESGLLLTEVLEEVWPSARAAVLSGPSFARDVARGLPTAVTLACADEGLAAQWAGTLGVRHFRPYLSDDLVGAELGGAVKNVLAIAAGVVDGRGFGESARAALIARGFAEFQRLGVARGAKPETMAGLSGLGDLVLTASSPQSRNMSLGRALGEGRALQDVLGERNTVSEGVATAEAVRALALSASVDMPICAAVADLVSGRKNVDEIIQDLLSRPITRENRS